MYEIYGTEMRCMLRSMRCRGRISERVSELDSVGAHEDPMGGLGEFSENSTSKANFRESMSIREAQAIAPVTANCGAFSGLDKGGPGKDEG